MGMTKGNARLHGESQEKYRTRLKNERLLIRGYLRGRRIWPASKGTYIRATHGEIGSRAVNNGI